jgi:hypothetical protein
MSIKSSIIDNTLIESFSLDFISKNYQFIISQLHDYIIPEIVEFISKIIKEFGLNHTLDLVDHSNMVNTTIKMNDEEEKGILMPTISCENELQFSNMAADISHKSEECVDIKNEELANQLPIEPIISISPPAEEFNQNNGTQSLLELLSQQLEEQQDCFFPSTDDNEKNNQDYFTCKLCPFPALNSITIAENRNETYAYCQSKYDIHCLTKKHKDSISKASAEDIALLPPCRVLKTFLCEVCDYETWIKEKFIDHCKSASHRLTPGHASMLPKQTAVYRCLLCKFATEDISVLENHHNSNDHVSNLTDRMQKVIHPDQEKAKIAPEFLKGSFNFRCNLCNFKGTNIYKFDIHCSSKRHLDNLAKATKDERAVLQAARTLKTYLCEACEYETWIKEMFHDHCSNSIHIENLISYEQDHQVYNSADLYQIAVYRCHPCKFETEDNFELVQHFKTDFHVTSTQSDEYYHENIEVEEKHISTKLIANKGTGNFVCKLCSYQASESHSFDAHCMSKGHKRAIAKASIDELATIPACKRFRTFLCEPCAYETVNNQNFIRHCLTEKHKTMPGSAATNPKQASLFRCNICKYASELKINLHDHIQKNIHFKNPPNAYQSYANDSYNNEEANFYSNDDDNGDDDENYENGNYCCKICSFQSTNASAYAAHRNTKRHKKSVASQEEDESNNDSNCKMKTMFCQICSFQASSALKFRVHCSGNAHTQASNRFLLKQGQKDNIPKPNKHSKKLGQEIPSFRIVKTYLCEACRYETNNNPNFIRHCKNTKHKTMPGNELINPHQPALYRCSECSFSTSESHILEYHILTHTASSSSSSIVQNDVSKVVQEDNLDDELGFDIDSFNEKKNYRTKPADKKEDARSSSRKNSYVDSSRSSSRRNSYVESVEDVIMKEDDDIDYDDDYDDDYYDEEYDEDYVDNHGNVRNAIDFGTAINNELDEGDEVDEEFNPNSIEPRRRRSFIGKGRGLSKINTKEEEKAKDPKISQVAQINAYLNQSGKILTGYTDAFQLTFQTEMQDGYKRNNKANGTKNIRCI